MVMRQGAKAKPLRSKKIKTLRNVGRLKENIARLAHQRFISA
jgi:hypothetical protein